MWQRLIMALMPVQKDILKATLFLTKQDLAEASEGIFAFNETLSKSGWAGPICSLKALDLFPNAVCKTGSQANSVHAIAEKHAYFVAIDAQTWRIFKA